MLFIVVTAKAASLPKRSPSSGYGRSSKSQVSSSEESDHEDQTNFLTGEIIQKLKKYDPEWFKVRIISRQKIHCKLAFFGITMMLSSPH